MSGVTASQRAIWAEYEARNLYASQRAVADRRTCRDCGGDFMRQPGGWDWDRRQCPVCVQRHREGLPRLSSASP